MGLIHPGSTVDWRLEDPFRQLQYNTPAMQPPKRKNIMPITKLMHFHSAALVMQIETPGPLALCKASAVTPPPSAATRRSRTAPPRRPVGEDSDLESESESMGWGFGCGSKSNRRGKPQVWAFVPTSQGNPFWTSGF